MPKLGHTTVIEVSTDDITYNEVDGILDYNFDMSNDVVDITAYEDTASAHERLLSLQDTSISLGGDYEHADVNGQLVLRNAFLNNTSVYVKILHNGTNGHKVQCLVTKLIIGAEVDEKVAVEFELTGIGLTTSTSGAGGGGGGSDLTWVKLTETMMDNGTGIVGSVDTMKSYAVDGSARLTMTFNTTAGTPNGHRETSGRAIDITDILSGFDRTTHNILVYMKNPTSTSIRHGVGIALVDNPGSSGDGVGCFMTSSRTASQSVDNVPTAGSDATLSDMYARFVIGDDQVSVHTWRKTDNTGNAFESMLNTSTSDSDAVDPDDVKVYVHCMVYSGGATEDDTASADVYFAAEPKFNEPP